jgi:hypothetical protein
MPTGDLTRNDVAYENSVIYALDLKAQDSVLMQYYPGRSFYKYVRDKEQVRGTLVKLR